MKNFILVLLFSFICTVQATPAHACLSQILEPTKLMQSLLSKDFKTLEPFERRIVTAYERDLKYFGDLPEGCHNIMLSEEQMSINQNIRQLILKKWTFETDLHKYGVE